MKVFLSQIKPLLGNIQQNIAIHESEIKKAISKGCELIVFPELSLSGYYLRDLVSDIAFQINSPVLKMFEEYSDEISIILGFVYEDENHNYYNAAAYFEDGILKHIHKKVYLPNYTMFEESRYFASGDTFIAFDMLGTKTGLLICEDALHLSSLYVYSLQSVKNIIIIANSPTRGLKPDRFYSQDLWYNTIKFIANNMTVNTIFVNRVGVEDGVTFWGGSVAINALGEVIAQGELFKDISFVVEIDESTIRRSRLTTPFYRDEDFSLVRKHLKILEQ
jgi:predicted amidohydrolase